MITIDLNKKHFSRYAEFRAAFELSRRGWNVYTPIYDEYIDIVAHKIVCKKCDNLWPVAIQTQCAKCGFIPKAKKCIDCQTIDMSLNIKNCKSCGSANLEIISGKICKNIVNGNICGQLNFVDAQKCIKCGKNILKAPKAKLCFKCNYKDFKDIEECLYCGGKEHRIKVITLQVKSSREVDNGENFGFKMKPRDLLHDNKHFFIWIGYRGVCCNPNKCNLPRRNCKNCQTRLQTKEEEEVILLMSVDEFKKAMGARINSRAFAVTQNDRLHPDKRTLREGNRLDFSPYLVTDINNRFNILERV